MTIAPSTSHAAAPGRLMIVFGRSVGHGSAVSAGTYTVGVNRQRAVLASQFVIHVG
jgi:hypothetical protein